MQGDAPPKARFAISVMDGRLQLTNQKGATNFLEGLLLLLDHDPICAIERLMSDTGIDAIKAAIQAKNTLFFWTFHFAPFLKALSTDEMREGPRGKLVTSVLKHIIAIPSVLKALRKHIDTGRFDPSLGMTVVDRVTSSDRSLLKDANVTGVIRVLADKLQGDTKSLLTAKYLRKGLHKKSAPRDTESYDLGVPVFDRHNNDHESIADILLLPSVEELECTRLPYLPYASNAAPNIVLLYERHFRWMREDFILSIRECVSVIRKNLAEISSRETVDLQEQDCYEGFGPVIFQELSCREHGGNGIVVSFPHPKSSELGDEGGQSLAEAQLPQEKTNCYNKFWEDNPGKLRKGSVVMFMESSSQKIILLGEITDGNHCTPGIKTHLKSEMSEIVVGFDHGQLPRAIHVMAEKKRGLLMIQVDVPFFSYKPILHQLQQMGQTPLARELLRGLGSTSDNFYPSSESESLLEQHPDLHDAFKLLGKSKVGQGIKSVLPSSTMSYKLDGQQMKALKTSLAKSMALIQGPPGTGKSLCGAVFGALICRFTPLRVLCMCFTNRALDQFLEDLIQVGVAERDIARLGSGCSSGPDSPLQRTRFGRLMSEAKLDILGRDMRATIRFIAKTRNVLSKLEHSIRRKEVMVVGLRKKDPATVMRYIEQKHPEQSSAFEAIPGSNQFEAFGKTREELFQKWLAGNSLPDNSPASVSTHKLWSLQELERENLAKSWVNEAVSSLCHAISEHDAILANYRNLKNLKAVKVLKSRRIIGCTTSGASLFADLLNGAGVDVLLIEEAAQILESHVLAALGNRVKHVVMIGDHLHLRPRLRNYELSVENEAAEHALDISLFERLVRSQIGYVKLHEQHRMHPTIARFLKELTYPDLCTAPSVPRRPLIGAPFRVNFVSHTSREDATLFKSRAGHSSYTNEKEVIWVCAICFYFLQQPEYNPSDIVVISPYLGQVAKLRTALERLLEIRVELNERDAADLPASEAVVTSSKESAKILSSTIRVATIDNFQGDEGNIIIASLVRSNSDCEIGYLSAPQKTNVLLSRAREAMIFIGNAETFTNDDTGGAMWSKIVDLFRREGHVANGLAIKCVVHGNEQLIKTPNEMLLNARDGGCNLPCTKTLECGHICQRSCHRGPCTSECPECKETGQAQGKMQKTNIEGECFKHTDTVTVNKKFDKLSVEPTVFEMTHSQRSETTKSRASNSAKAQNPDRAHDQRQSESERKFFVDADELLQQRMLEMTLENAKAEKRYNIEHYKDINTRSDSEIEMSDKVGDSVSGVDGSKTE